MSDEREIPKIGYSEPVKVKHVAFPVVEPLDPKNIEKIETPEAPPRLPARIELTLWEKIGFGITTVFSVTKLLFKIKEIQMSEDKTTTTTGKKGLIGAIIAALTSMLVFFGIDLPDGFAEIIITAITSVWALVAAIMVILKKKNANPEAK